MGAIAEKEAKKDLHGRTEMDAKNDKWFNEECSKLQNRSGSLQPLPATRYGFASKGAFLSITRERGEEKSSEKVPITPGLYDLKLLQSVGAELAKQKEPSDALTKKLFQRATVKFGVSVGAEGQLGQMGVSFAPVPDGYIVVPTVPAPVLGTPILFQEDGSHNYGSFTSEEEFARWLPAIQSGFHVHNTWCVDLPCDRVASMANGAEAMLANLNEQLKNVHGVSIYSIAPRWFRYFSDGDMRSQRSGAYGIRSASHPGGGVRPLLYDAPAWAVGLRIGGNMIPGRVFVTPEGNFIASDWCQREADKNGGIDLHTGQYTKHTLMTWCAGPGISRFGTIKTATQHGEIRRAVIRQPHKDIPVAKQVARKKLLKLLVEAKIEMKKSGMDGGDSWDGRGFDDETTQADSLRYFTASDVEDGNMNTNLHDQEIGFIARFGHYVHMVSVPTKIDNGMIDVARTTFMKTAGKITKKDIWQVDYANESWICVNDELAAEIVKTMKEAI